MYIKIILTYIIFTSLGIIYCITNGNEAPQFLYSFMVSIQDQKSGHFCSGVLISSSLVITAGHCIASRLRSEVILKLNRHNLLLKDEEEGGLNVMVTEIYLHPEYDSNSRGIQNDIAILKLEDKLANIKEDPYSLPKYNENNYNQRQYYFPVIDEKDLAKKVNLNLKILGWGSFHSESAISNILSIGELPVFEPLTCYRYLNTNYDLNFKQEFCAGYHSGIIDACQGDSGGPALYLDESKNSLFLVGIISFGFKCGRPNTPGIYTRIFNYKNWIKEIINETDYTLTPIKDYY